MQVIIFTSKRRKKMLKQILNWGNNQPLKYQLFFTRDLKKIRNLSKAKNTLIVTTEVKLYDVLKAEITNICIVENDWNDGAKIYAN